MLCHLLGLQPCCTTHTLHTISHLTVTVLPGATPYPYYHGPAGLPYQGPMSSPGTKSHNVSLAEFCMEYGISESDQRKLEVLECFRVIEVSRDLRKRCYSFSSFLLTLVTLTTLTFPSTVQPVHLFFYSLYSFALLAAATRIASPFPFHHCYAFLPSWYAVPLGLCASFCSINTASFSM